MLRVRVIPTLLLKNGGLVKGVRFKGHRYVGDPINAVKIFNEKEVDELVFLDIGATPEGYAPDFEVIRDIASEAFMPFGYGGGVTSVDQMERLFKLGVEKVIFNTAAHTQKSLIRDASRNAGAQSVVVSVDVRRSWLGKYEVVVGCGGKRTGLDPVEYAQRMEDSGAGEIMLCSIDREGTGNGFDIDLVKAVSDVVHIPVVAVGGAATVDDFSKAITDGGASAVGAGDMFVFHGSRKAVLITYPPYEELEQKLNSR